MSATVVLVHGAWHGAWCWERLTPLLDEAGINSVAVDLPGHGDNASPLTDMHGDADHVRSVLDGIDGPVVLVGHSYGGIVITDAGTHPAVRHLVFVAALAIDADETAGSAVTAEAENEVVEHPKPGLADAMQFHDDGTCTLPPQGVADFLYNECDAATQQWAAERVCPQPMVTMAQSPRDVAWRERPSTYVVCEKDRGIPAGLQRILARRCTNTVSLDTDHSPFASTPHLLAPILVDLATD